MRVSALAVAAAVLLGSVVAPTLSASTSVLYASACACLTLEVVFTVWLDWRGSLDIMSVLALTGFFYLLAFVAGSIFAWFNPSFGLPVRFQFAFTHEGLMRAEWLCALAWAAFATGYRLHGLAFLRIPPLRLRAPSESARAHAMLLLYFVGWIARIVGIPRGLYFHVVSGPSGPVAATASTGNQIIFIFGLLSSISVAYLGVRACTAPVLRLWYRLALLVELAWAIPSGARVDAVTVFVLALCVALYTRRRFPLKAALIFSLLALFLLFPVLYLYRNTNTQTGYQVSDLGQGLTSYTSSGTSSALLFGIGSTLTRFADIELPAALEERGRQVYPAPDGSTIPWVVANYIPHALDPAKPSVLAFTNNLAYALRLSPVHNSSFAATQIGELYLDFGTVGVAVAMLILGTVYRELNEWLILRWQDPGVLAVYAALAYTIIRTQETFLANGLSGLLRGLLVLVLIIRATAWLLERRRSGRFR